jgi:hypothetical protein
MPDAEWCWSHHPDHAGERHRRASKGGKRGGRGRARGELEEIKGGIRTVIDDVLSGELHEIGRGAVALQGYNALLRAAEQERKAKESEDLERRIETLERAQDQQRGAKTWRGA